MKLRDMTELAVRNLREAIFRNTLTTLGVAVGVDDDRMAVNLMATYRPVERVGDRAVAGHAEDE